LVSSRIDAQIPQRWPAALTVAYSFGRVGILAVSLSNAVLRSLSIGLQFDVRSASHVCDNSSDRSFRRLFQAEILRAAISFAILQGSGLVDVIEMAYTAEVAPTCATDRAF
jgi:hypothetical protein